MSNNEIRNSLKWSYGRPLGMVAFPNGPSQPIGLSSGEQEKDHFDPTKYAGSLGVRVPGVVSVSKEDLPTSAERVDKIITSGLQNGKTVYLIDKVYNKTIYQRTICLFDARDESMVEHLKSQGRLIILTPYSVEDSLNAAGVHSLSP